MKKLVLAAAIAAIAGNAMAAEMYSSEDATLNVFGEIRAKLQDTRDDKENSFSMSSSKLGVKGGYELSDDLTAKGYVRYKYNGNSGSTDNFKSDKTWVGLSSKKFGEVRIGRMGTIHDDEMWMHDFSWAFGGNAVNGGDAMGTGVQDSLLSYTYGFDFGLTLKGQYQIAPAKDQSTVNYYNAQGSEKSSNLKATIDNGYSLGAIYQSDFGLGLTAVYTSVDLKDFKVHDVETKSTVAPTTGSPIVVTTTSDLTVGTGKADSNTLGFGVSYSIQGLSVAAEMTKLEIQSETKSAFDMEADGFGAGVKYDFDNGYAVYGVYELRERDFKHVTAGFTEDTTTYVLGAQYRPHKSVVTYVEYVDAETEVKLNNVKSDSDAKSWQLGARWYF